MNTIPGQEPRTLPRTERDVIGKVVSVTGSQVGVGLTLASQTGAETAQATVGRMLGILHGRSIIVGMITAVAEQPPASRDPMHRAVANLDLVGEIKTGETGTARFQRGVSDYPAIGTPAMMLGARELRLVYGATGGNNGLIGSLHQDPTIGAYIKIDELLNKHFAILGTTGVGKSNGVAIILQQILDTRPNLRLFLVDPHNEYGDCFGSKAQVLAPNNLRLPFWLFNFEEIVDVFFGNRPGVDEEVEILSDVIPLAKAAYHQYKTPSDRQIAKRRDVRSAGYTADTPIPYRFEDLVGLIDERMGKLENRSLRVKYMRLISRIQTVRNNPRYSFMFENANIGGDTMADLLSHLFRLPPNGVPMTVMQLAGFPAEVVDAVVSVLCRMAFDFGLWSDGVAPLLLVCEEAHRYAPANAESGFGPTRRALSRIAKEGRKYGVFLGLVTQRPAEIDPTIISQCSTLFAMRMSNDRDQALIRSAVSDAAVNLLSFIPSLATREVFAFGAGVTVPTRLKFKELPVALRPVNNVDNTDSEAAAIERDLMGPVIERWRNATMSQKLAFEDEPIDPVPPLRTEVPPLQSAPPLQPVQPPAAAPSAGLGLDPQRFRLLRRTSDPAPDVFAGPDRRTPR